MAILGTDFSILLSHSWWIHIILSDKENSPEVVPVMQIINGNGEAKSVIPSDEKTPAKETLEVPSGNNISTNAIHYMPGSRKFFQTGSNFF